MISVEQAGVAARQALLPGWQGHFPWKQSRSTHVRRGPIRLAEIKGTYGIGVTVPLSILARGPWRPADVEVCWSQQPFVLSPQVTDKIDRALAELRRRNSPGHEGLAARLAGFAVDGGRLRLMCQPVRWGLHLLPDAMQSLSVSCVVRSADGRWLAGRRAARVATSAGSWELGATGSVDVAENPADTLVRELAEEWQVMTARLTVEALVKPPSGRVSLVGLAWLADDATVTPGDEHDDHAWWPAELSDWPSYADAALRELAKLVTVSA